MQYLSLFSGIGGFELGIQQAYESNLERKHLGEESEQEERPQGREWASDEYREVLCSPDGPTPLCVGYSEIDKYAVQIYQKHFSEHKNYGDITKIDTDFLPDFDLLVGGFPCQAFSIAGKRGGFEDTRGTLFFEIARILRAKQPRLFLLENVKGLLSHDNGQTFRTIITTLDELGYDLQWQVLNSKNFGVPQNRERVFIVGHLRGTSRPEVFPIRESGELHYAKSSKRQGECAATVRASGNDERNIVAVPTKFLERNQFTVDTVGTGGVMVDYQIRRLTPTECERLQGFPDGWTEGVSDTQRYKTLGNAVTVNVVEEIIKRLIPDLLTTKK